MALEEQLENVRKTLKLFGVQQELIDQEVWFACVLLAGSPPGTRIEIRRDLYGVISMGTVVVDPKMN